MRDEENLSEVIGDIYDAALDPALWTEVLAHLARFVGGQGAGLLLKNSVNLIGDIEFHVGVRPDYVKLYKEKYWRFDPLAPLIFFGVGQVTSSTDYLPEEEFRSSRFYREWAQPQGWIDAANVVLEKSVTCCAILSVLRDEIGGPVDEEMRRRVRLLVPHVRRAIAIGQAIGLKQADAASLADALDGIRAGMFLVDAGGRIVHANAAACSMLAIADLLCAANGRLIAQDPQGDRILHETFVAAGKGDMAIGIKGTAVPLTSSGGEPYVAHVLPLTSGARRRATSTYAAVAALFIHRAALETLSPPEAIARHYRLTPTELRVLLAIVEVGGVPEVADALGIGVTTVKTHLGRLYEKTGGHRQADLVKLVAGYASPLRG